MGIGRGGGKKGVANMKQFAIARYRVVPSSDGQYVSLECETGGKERFTFGFLPSVARGIGIELQVAATNVEVSEKGATDGRQGESSESTMITEVKLRLGLNDLQLSELIHCAWGTIAKVEAGKARLTDVSRERLEQLSEDKAS
jgi:hypothetical protein